MQGSFYRFYVHENHQHHGRPVWEWLLAQANKRGIRGGSAFKAMSGFGRHHALHQSNPLKLDGALAVEIEFFLTDGEAQDLLAFLQQQRVGLFYAQVPALYDVVNPDSAD